MRKVALAVVAVFFLALLGLAFAASRKPDGYHIERSLTMGAPPPAVYPHVAELPRWEAWSPWRAKDATVRSQYDGTPGAAGSSMTWTSERSGSGKLTVTEVDPDRRVRYKLHFADWDSTSEGELRIAPEGEGSRVTWSMEGTNTFTGKVVWMLFDMESAIAADFDRGLTLLKGVVEGRL